MTEYQLRKHFLVLQLLDNRNNLVAKIQINLYLLCTGPYHQDFEIDFKNGNKGRINFDFKVSQIVELRLQSTFAQVELATHHPGEKFNFSIKSIVGNHNFQSSLSYKVAIKLRQQNLQENQQAMKKKKTIKYAQKIIEQGSKLIWCKQQQLQLPYLVFNIEAFSLHHGCFQILIWKIDDLDDLSHFQQKPKLYAECYISLQKLFLAEYHSLNENGKQYQIREIDVEQKLWYHGIQNGKGRFKFNVKIQKYIKQMQVCIRTQQGILNTSPVFKQYDNTDKKNQSSCQELTELIAICNEIQANVITLEKSSKVTNFQKRQIQRKIERKLEQMAPILKKTCKQSTTIYNYSSQTQLMMGQKTLLKIGLKLFEYTQDEDPIINQLCTQMLISLLRRSQFMLCYIGFDQKEKQLIQKNQIDTLTNMKIQNALMYQQFIYQMLGLALKNINIKGLEYQRSFSQIFCAYAYFRIPQFRNQILNSFTKESDPQIVQWIGIQLNIYQDIDYENIKEDMNTFTILFDWTNRFHKCLSKFTKYKSNLTQLTDILSNVEWKQKMNRRGTSFFLFIKEWVNYIESIVIKTRDMQWKYLPGYNRIIRSFLVEMKKRTLTQYPDALKVACCSLLANQKLLNIFLSIILNKSDMNDALSVLKGIYLINSLLQTLSSTKRSFPQTFNYLQFAKAIKIILESQFSYAIAQLLSLLYTYFHFFHIEFKKNLSMYLLGKVFFRLFLHWSQNVRIVFYYLMTIRIYSQLQSVGHDGDKHANKFNEDIKSRYERLLIMIEYKYKNYVQNRSVMAILEKDLYKKMRNKINTKKKLPQIIDISKVSKNNSDINAKKTTEQEMFKCPIDLESQKIERTNSEILKNSIINLPLKNNSKFQKQQVIKLSRKASFSFQYEVRDAIEVKHQLKKKSNIYMFDEADVQIQPIIPSHLPYLKIALQQFTEANSKLKNIYESKSQNEDIPLIKLQMPIDVNQLRPQKIDQW